MAPLLILIVGNAQADVKNTPTAAHKGGLP
jgi:hypothetical protein